jgi:hypothetical protein
MGVVVKFPGHTIADIDPKQILSSACELVFDDVFVMGRLSCGATYLSGSTADIGRFLILVEQLKRQMIPDATGG